MAYALVFSFLFFVMVAYFEVYVLDKIKIHCWARWLNITYTIAQEAWKRQDKRCWPPFLALFLFFFFRNFKSSHSTPSFSSVSIKWQLGVSARLVMSLS